MRHLSLLNERQREAVLRTEGPLLILAGAGAGKTKTIAHRVIHLISLGVNPSNILAITFTNKAAREMRERVERLIQTEADLNRPIAISERPFVSTFHALGVHILKENCRFLGIPRHFNIFDRGDSISAVRSAIKELGFDPKQFEPGRLLSAISRKKGDGVNLLKFMEENRRDFMNRILLSVWQKYEETLQVEKALDFDDLLLKSLGLLFEHKDILLRYQSAWPYLHIDEYQDTNKVQYDMALMLAGGKRNICVVGDIDQSIYSWRGADFKNIMRFEKDYKDAKVILLEENYRSTKTILSAANTVIKKNTLRKEKNLFTNNEVGEKITLYGSFDEEDEAAYVADKSSEIIDKGTPASNIAVLYRANFQSRVLEEAFLTLNIPYQVLGVRFFERKEVKDVLSYLKAALNPESLADLKRIFNVPPRGIGKVTIAKIFSGEEKLLPGNTRAKISTFRKLLGEIKECALNNKPSETINFIITESGIIDHFKNGDEEDHERLQNIFELLSLSSKYDFLPPGEGIEHLLTDAALASDQDELKETKETVKLMTVHASKGLEFEYVFITGLEADLFPYKHGDGETETLEEAEEERRLFYVALTRAKKKLFLSYTAVRSIFGSKQVNVPSDFLSDIDEDLIESAQSEERSAPREKIIYLE